MYVGEGGSHYTLWLSSGVHDGHLTLQNKHCRYVVMALARQAGRQAPRLSLEFCAQAFDIAEDF